MAARGRAGLAEVVEDLLLPAPRGHGEAAHPIEFLVFGRLEPLDGVVRVDYSDGVRAPRFSQLRQIQGGPDAFNVLQDWTEMPDLRPTFDN